MAETQRIRSLIEIGRYAEAREAAASALAAAPDSADLHHLMATTLLQLDAPRDARRHAERACSLAPEDPDHAMNLARAMWLLKDLHGARGLSLEAVRLAPLSGRTHALFAQIQADLAPGTSDAHNAAIRAVDLAPNAAYSHFAAGYVFQSAGDHKRARQAYRATLAIDPDHAAALNNLGVMGDSLPEAARSYRAALSVDPQHRTARRNLETIVPRLVWQLWVVGAVMAIGGALLTIAGGSTEHSGPTRGSVLLALVALLGFAAQCRRVLRELPRSAVRHLLRVYAHNRKHLYAAAVTLLMLALGVVACVVPGGGSLIRQLTPAIAASGAIQLYNRTRR